MMRAIIFVLILLIIVAGCSKEGTNEDLITESDNIIGDNIDVVTTLLVTTTTQECHRTESFDISYSYDRIERSDIEREIKDFHTLPYEVTNYEKKISKSGYNEYIFWKNENFVDFSNNLVINGIFTQSGIFDISSISTSQNIEIKNLDGEYDGVFMVERIFPGLRNGYFIQDSKNLEKVFIEAKQKVNVSFDIGVICYKIADISGQVNLMTYFIQQAEKISDQKDLIVDRRDNMLYTCERAHYRVIPPKIEVTRTIETEENTIVNEQGSDNFIKFNECPE